MNIEDALKETRKTFFAYRNGIIADTLRKSGDPHTMIMGCQLTDVMAIAKTLEPSVELAEAFWSDSKHRECRMIAPMLYPVDSMNIETAIKWCTNVENYEIADVLCLRLLRKCDFAMDLFNQLADNEKPLVKYTAYRLLLHLVMLEKVEKTELLKAKLELQQESAPGKLKAVINSILEEF